MSAPTRSQDPATGTGFAWNDRILGGRAPHTDGYGVRPRDARPRAATVRAAVHPTSQARRPLALLLFGGALGVVGWILLAYAGADAASLRHVSGRDALVAGLALFPYLGGIGVFAWGWQLGDRTKAIRFAAVVAVLGLVAWLIVVVVVLLLVAAAKDGGGSIDLNFGAGPGSGSGSSSGAVGAGSSGGGGGSWAPIFWGGSVSGGRRKEPKEEPDVPRCGVCGNPLEPGKDHCWSCGAAVGWEPPEDGPVEPPA